MKRKTHEEFVREVYNLVGDEYTVIGTYRNAKTKLKVRHNKGNCCYEYYVTPNNFLRGKRCPNCAGNKKKTDDQFKQEVFDLVGKEYIVIGKYMNSSTKIKMKHVKCNHIWEVKPENFLNSNTRCPKCQGRNRTTKEFKDIVRKLVGDEYIVIGEYKNAKSPVQMKHCACNHLYFVSPNNFLSGNRCPRCAKNQKLSQEEFVSRIYDLVGDEYLVLSKYIKANEKVKIKHKNCEYMYEVTPNNFFNGKRCPKCNESKGEEKIADYLLKNNFNFDRQFKFEDCVNENILRFDFVVYEDVSKCKIKCLIEYDGIQHFEPVDFFGGIEKFHYTVNNDKIKNKYCNDNNIKLFRIPFYKFNEIESELDLLLK